ncbi:probable protein phosphatase 2C 6 [Rosa rugosa]|uniref:probable protein phosphatase 2C 6 n=1 Tax=Rosa rugosa TaxID=74645 RepID=UPI002B415572|nr:probable protein phosphatase 2C 6 [Rosa rugosa]
MTDSGNTTTTNLPPTPTPFETLIPNAEIPESLSSAAASPKSEGASTEPEPKAVAAATESSESSGGEVVFVGRKNRAVSWGYSLNIGRRRGMEDTLTIVPSFMKIPCASVGGCTAPECTYVTEESSVHYFGLFDGHGGSEVSRYCSKSLHELLAEEWEKGSGEDQWNKRWTGALVRAYNRADDAPDTVGSTAVVVILSACQIIVANCGDSRAVLCRGNQVIPLTVDHKPDRDDEVIRVTEAGGRILYVGCPTVEGVLTMTRAIGDQDLKPWIISEPEVTVLTRTDTDECLILASDGLWDVMSNEKVMAMARRMLRELRNQYATAANGSVGPAQYVAEEVLKNALQTSTDNVSIIVVDLKRLRRRMQQKAEADI